jgi:signal transduction histidine kinase
MPAAKPSSGNPSSSNPSSAKPSLAKPWPIVALAVEIEQDLVAVRQRAGRIAELIGFGAQDKTRIATAVSEIARNALAYGGGGRVKFAFDATAVPPMFLADIKDSGGGIADLDAVLEGRYRSATGMGLGLIGARRLMDHFSIVSDARHGTRVELGKKLPGGVAPLDQQRLKVIVGLLAKENAHDPIVALRDQNRELIESLDEIRRRQIEADQLNLELADTNRGVVALYAELDERAEQLRLASESKTRFLSNMSHEFRTPLNSVIALTRLLLDRIDGELTAEQEHQISLVRRSALGLLELVTDLLDIAKVEAGKIDIRPERFTVSDLFSALRGVLKPLQAQSTVELVFDAREPAVELDTDEGKVAQVLRNLIANALKFTPHGEVRLTSTSDPVTGRIVFTVSDTGIGIAADDIPKIFEEFVQVDGPLQRHAGGTGLGLPLSKKLAEVLGGDIRVESVVGRGSVFTLDIPAVHPSVDRAGRPVEGDQPRRRILVVDDDETFRYVLRQIITEKGYEVIEAIDGVEGLARLRADKPDAVVLDLQMPRLDGFGVLREKLADPAISDVPVIISTSLVVDADLAGRLPAGVPILTKETLSRDKVSGLLDQVLGLRPSSWQQPD